jgi:hypothetical protein
MPLSKRTMKSPTTAMTPRIISAIVNGFIWTPPCRQEDNLREPVKILLRHRREGPTELKLSGFAKGPATRMAKATLDMSQKYFARFSLCFSVRMIFMGRFYGFENSPLPEGASMTVVKELIWRADKVIR